MSRGWLFLAMFLLAPEPVSIHAPAVIMAGSSVRIACQVPRQADNRWLEIALVPYRSSGVQLDGDQAPITHEVIYEHVPCAVTEADCILSTTTRKHYATQTVLIAGCDQ